MNQTIKPTLWLLPYQANNFVATELRQLLASNQQHRFDTLRGKRQIEFGVTRLLLQQCMKYTLHSQLEIKDNIIDIVEQKNLPPCIEVAKHNKLSFSISHSKNVIAILIAPTSSARHQWGLDIEQCRSIRNPESATMFCNGTQLSALEQSSKDDYNKLYYQFWTQKEAVLKARLTGIVDGDLKKIEGVFNHEPAPLRSSQFVNPIDQSDYTISAYHHENTQTINCQLLTLNQNHQFNQQRELELAWQNFQLNS